MYGNGVPLVAEKSNITLEKVALHSADNRAVVLKDSKLTMNDSYIFRSHQGIYMQNSHLTMNGGAIANNTSWQYMDDSQGDWYNIANIPFYFGGGIYARTGSVVLDKNARIVSNEGGSGGGIALGSSKDLNYAGDTSNDRSATLYIKQGIVGNNKANQREGGGIATVWDTNSTVQIDNGKIINNKTGDMTSDWGGGGLYIAEGTTLIMPYNTQVTQNTALGLGGGITGCSTSENFLSYEFDVYGNTGRNTNYTSDRTEKPIDKAYKDGTTNHPATWYQGAEGVIPNDYYLHNHSYVRNKGTLKGVVDGESITEKSNMHANEYMMGIGSKTLDDYKVVIQGNQSNTHGGGVMNNGVVIAGTFDDMRTSIEAIKELQEVDGTVVGITKEQFRFNLKKNGKVLSTAKNDNTGKIAFSNIPIQEGVYTIEEDTSNLKGYESVVGEVKFNFETEVVETPSATELKQIDGIYYGWDSLQLHRKFHPKQESPLL